MARRNAQAIINMAETAVSRAEERYGDIPEWHRWDAVAEYLGLGGGYKYRQDVLSAYERMLGKKYKTSRTIQRRQRPQQPETYPSREDMIPVIAWRAAEEEVGEDSAGFDMHRARKHSALRNLSEPELKRLYKQYMDKDTQPQHH